MGRKLAERIDKRIDLFIRMEAQGCTRPEKLQAVFGITDTRSTEAHNADNQMVRWRKLPQYKTIWDDELTKQDYEAIGLARKRLLAQLNSNNEWLVNKAANDLIAQGNRRIYGADDSTVHVQVSGMPDIGSPDQPEEDG